MQISMRLKKAGSGSGMVMSGTATVAQNVGGTGLRFYYGIFVAGGDRGTGHGSVSGDSISMNIRSDILLQTGNNNDAYWMEENPWNPGGLVRGVYTTMSASAWEMTIGVSNQIGTNGEVAGRMAWKWPTGTTEVKAYPAFIKGNKPGYYNTGPTPAGKPIYLLDGTTATSAPCGTTPGSFFPLALPIGTLNAQVAYSHMATANGQGHLSFDIWLQNSPTQINGFSAPPITHEIMIPLNNWGGYGVHPTGRNPDWYAHDKTLDGALYHVYYAPNFNGAWKFIVFQPDTTSVAPSTLNLSTFINYGLNQTDSATPSQMWIASGMYCVSVELGVEPVEGTGDVMICNYRVYT